MDRKNSLLVDTPFIFIKYIIYIRISTLKTNHLNILILSFSRNKEAVALPLKIRFATWPGGTARTLQILSDGFDSQLEPIAFDIGL